MRPRAQAFAWVGIAAIGVTVLLTVLVPLPAKDVPSQLLDGVAIDYGIGRESRIGSQLIDVCDAARQAKPTSPWVEGEDGTCAAPTTAGNAASAKRPAVLSTAPRRDFGRCPESSTATDTATDNDGTSTRSEVWPSEQITATSELVGVTGLRTIVKADPSSPYPVPSGAYCGTLVIERAGGRVNLVQVALILDPKDSWWAVGKALIAVLTGAAAGLGIRLLNDPFSKLVKPFRHYVAVRRAYEAMPLDWKIGQGGAVTTRLANALDALQTFDPEEAEAQLTKAVAILEAPAPGSQPAAAPLANTQPATAGAPPSPPPANPVFWLLQRYWGLAFVAVVIVVAATGLWTQYVNNVNFHGTFGDWGKLVAYGLAAQLTIGGVTEALGKLAPASAK